MAQPTSLPAPAAQPPLPRRSSPKPLRLLPLFVIAVATLVAYDGIWNTPRTRLITRGPWALAYVCPFVLLLSLRRNRRGALVLALGLLGGQIVSMLSFSGLAAGFPVTRPFSAGIAALSIGLILLMVLEIWASLGRPSLREAIAERGFGFIIGMSLPVAACIGPFGVDFIVGSCVHFLSALARRV